MVMRHCDHRPVKLMVLALTRLPDATMSSLRWWAWPEVFGSTAGPGGGIGGQAMTTFTVWGFWDEATGTGVKYCAGRWKQWCDFPRQAW